MPGFARDVAKAIDAFRRGGARGLGAALHAAWTARARPHARRLRSSWRQAIEFGVRPHLLRGRVTHVHGPSRIQYGPTDLLVISVVRNGSLHVKSFMEHYAALGVAHHVFLDNGSEDDTIERLCAYPRVTVLRTDAPYDRYENTMKRYLAERFSHDRWNLCADIDELFDYPYSDQLPLSAFLQYLNARGFTAVVTQMLDMFSDVPLSDVQSAPDDRLQEKYPFYDTSAIEACPYEWSTTPNPAIRMHWGGVRRAVFGTDNGLTKAALVRMDRRVRPFVEWHQAAGADVADVTGVLLHYPFVSTFVTKVQDAVRTGRYGVKTTDEYMTYARALAADPALGLQRATARRFAGLQPLVDEGFLVVSDEYRTWVDQHAGRGA